MAESSSMPGPLGLNLITLGLTTLVTGLVGAMVGSLAGYYRTKAEREAAHRDFERVLAETRSTTEAIKRIEQSFAQGNIIFTAELAYRQRQLAEFYGPIYASLHLTSRLWRLLSECKIGSVRGPVMDLFRSQNDMILKLLQTKFDLVEGGCIPPSFARYATAVTLFNFGTKVGPDNNNPPDVAGLEEARFPQEFLDYITSTTEGLKQKLAQLYEEARVHSRQSPTVSLQRTRSAATPAGEEEATPGGPVR
jgi:hypothetical protein